MKLSKRLSLRIYLAMLLVLLVPFVQGQQKRGCAECNFKDGITDDPAYNKLEARILAGTPITNIKQLQQDVQIMLNHFTGNTNAPGVTASISLPGQRDDLLMFAAGCAVPPGWETTADKADQTSKDELLALDAGGCPIHIQPMENCKSNPPCYWCSGTQAMCPDYLMEIGSMTKTFTAALMLKYQECGMITMDATLTQRLPAIVSDRVDGYITVRQMLNMTSGLYNFSDNINYPVANPAAQLAAFKRSLYKINMTHQGMPGRTSEYRFWMPRDVLDYLEKPLFAPGENYSYCNTGFVLSGMILQNLNNNWDVAPTYREVFFDPLGFKNTYFAGYETVPQCQMAPGWWQDSGTPRNVLNGSRNAFYTAYWTAGAIVSSSRQMVQWIYKLYGTNEVLEPQSLKEMLDFGEGFPNQLPLYSSFVIPGISYNGFGLGTQRYMVSNPSTTTNMELVGYNGETQGYLSSGLYNKEKDFAFCMLLNSREGIDELFQMERDMARILYLYQPSN